LYERRSVDNNRVTVAAVRRKRLPVNNLRSKQWARFRREMPFSRHSTAITGHHLQSPFFT
jgi:hypothetical protein